MGQAKQKKARGATGEKQAYRAEVHVYGLVQADRAPGQTPEFFGVAHPNTKIDAQIVGILGGPTEAFNGVLEGYPNLRVYLLGEHHDLPRNSDATAAMIGALMREGQTMEAIPELMSWLNGPAVFRWTEVWPSIEVPVPAELMGALLPTMSRHGVPIRFLVKATSPNKCRVYTPDEDAIAVQCLLASMIVQAQLREAANLN